MKNLLLYIGFPVLFMAFTSCESAQKAENTANRFFTHLIQGQMEKAASMVEQGQMSALEMNTNLELLRKDGSKGNLLSARKGMGFNSQINNGVTTVNLPYKLKYQNGSRKVQVTLVDTGRGFRIVSLQ